MSDVTTLYYVNGGAPQVTTCANCGVLLGKERAIASFPNGPKLFCKAEPGDTDSCYLDYKRRRH